MRLSDYSQSGGRGLYRRDRRLFDQRGTYTFTIPDGVTKIWAFCMGAGGGANTTGGANNNLFGMLGGGKGGGYASGLISGLTPGGTLTITVGSGGVGQYRATAATGGGNSTVVGGSTTYLQGNGGGAGMSSVVTSDPGNQKGQGGAASTNSVTDAYTAAGGGSGSWMAGIDGQGGIDADEQSIVTGGGASGSPFGTGMGGGKSVKVSKTGTGGGGWTQRDYPHTDWIVSSSSNYRNDRQGIPGYGSHHPPKLLYNSYRFNTSQLLGGKGRTAKGGMTFNATGFSSSINYNNSYYGNDLDLNFGSSWFGEKSYFEVINGEDNNPNWWFPWEIDGGGGGGSRVDDNSARFCRAGDAGPGGGGGGIFGDFSQWAQAIGGDGGFGGGGGGAWAELGSINSLGAAIGGRGGNGGGGGAAKGRIESSKYMPMGGDGGDGAIGIYW